MSVNIDGSHTCDRCGIDVGGGGVPNCAIVSDLDPDNPGMIRNLEFCRDHPDPANPDLEIKGCARKLVTPSMIAHYVKMNPPE